MPIRFRTLGQIDLHSADGRELDGLLAQPKRVAVLAYLAANSPRLSRRDTLLAMFWPESDAEHARSSLRKALHFIRQEVGDVIVTRGTDEVGLRTEDVEVDIWELDAHIAEGRNGEAMQLYAGDFLPGFFIRGAPEFERWLEVEREKLRARAAGAIWLHAEERVSAGDLDGTRAAALRALEVSPHDEVALRRVISMLAQHGDRAGAISVYQAFAARVEADLQVTPAPETRALAESISTTNTITSVAPIEPRMPAPSLVAHTDRPSERPKWRGVFVALAAGIAVVVSALAYYVNTTSAAPDLNEGRLAVFPFLVRGSSDTRYLQDGLPILLGTRLDGAGSLRSIDSRVTFLDVRRERSGDSITPARASETAARLGARYFVLGTVVGSPSALHLDVELYDRRQGGARVARSEASGSEADLMRLVDRVATDLVAGTFRDNRSATSQTAALTSTSLAALKAWLRGESALASGRYLPAIEAFREAIGFDSTFAMAHYRLALAANWAGEMSLVVPESQRALDFSGRLKPYERTIVEAYWHGRRGHYAVAESLYRSVLVEHPTAVESWYDLAEILYHGNPQKGRPIAEARGAFEQVLRLDPGHFAAVVHLARLAAARRDLPALDSLTSKALKGDPDGPHRAELLLLRSVSLADSAATGSYLHEPHTIADLDALWRSAEYSGQVDRIIEVAEQVLRGASGDEMRSSMQLLLAHLEMGRENFAGAERRVDSLAKLSPQTALLTRMLLATHPALPVAERSAIVASTRRAFAATTSSRRGARVFVGMMRSDDATPYGDGLRAALALASGDTAHVRQWLAATADVAPTSSIPLMRQWLAMSVAGDSASRAQQLRDMERFDLDIANRYISPTPFLPRALNHLVAARLLEGAGRPQDALAHLNAVPEDLGFNVAYMRELERRRAALRGTKP
ncbi:MAG: BTAD domain-containing putative transcriptional regulator [Gemmatimonadota bacterium]